jgi:adenylosuccinate lyase
MIKRYRSKKITDIFGIDGEGAYKYWLIVELAILDAKAYLGLIPADAAKVIRSFAKYDAKRIEEIEDVRKHDLQSFVENVRESPGIPEEYKKYFHEDITSFDTEEPATSLMVRAATKVVIDSLDRLLEALKNQALKYKFLYKIHRTHGQHAQPVTYGLELLWWYDGCKRQKKYINFALDEMEYSKISGAVGTYWPRLSPELERRALALLDLKPAPISAQINLRDRLAHLMNALAVLMSVVEHVLRICVFTDRRKSVKCKSLSVKARRDLQQCRIRRIPSQAKTCAAKPEMPDILQRVLWKRYQHGVHGTLIIPRRNGFLFRTCSTQLYIH